MKEVDSSLTPPLAILDHVQILREIMNVYQSSLLGEDEVEQVAGFEKILDIMIDPAIEMITKTNEDKSRLGTERDQPIYVLNCLSYIEVCFATVTTAITTYFLPSIDCSRTVLIHASEAKIYQSFDR